MADLKYKIGDKVWAEGKVFQSANGTLEAKPIKRQLATIRKVAEKGKHPYMIEGMWGWLDQKSLKPFEALPDIKQGDKVTLIKNRMYNNLPIKLPHDIIFEVEKVIDNQVHVKRIDSPLKIVVNINNLKKVEEE